MSLKDHPIWLVIGAVTGIASVGASYMQMQQSAEQKQTQPPPTVVQMIAPPQFIPLEQPQAAPVTAIPVETTSVELTEADPLTDTSQPEATNPAVDAFAAPPDTLTVEMAARQDAAAQAAAQQLANQQQSNQMTEMRLRLDQANQKINIIWDSASNATQQNLRSEQRAWLKKREVDCKLSSMDVAPDQQELVRTSCEVTLTTQRITGLKLAVDGAENRIAIREQQELMQSHKVPTYTPSTAMRGTAVQYAEPKRTRQPETSNDDEISRRVAEQNAARMAANVQILQRQLGQ